jgi:protoheme IX farnesyltransferase
MNVAVQTRVERENIGFSRKLRAYVALTKPRIIELLLVTTAPVMILAQRGIPNLWLMLATLIGGALSAGSAGAFNCYIDRDIDRVMKRTSKRPLVTGELSDREALVFSWVIGAVSFLWLGFLVNWLSAALSLAALLFYVLLYTLVLKRRTSQNIIWGGIAGCFPALIGWSAVTNSLSWTPVILFFVVFLWTPPHSCSSRSHRWDSCTPWSPLLPEAGSSSSPTAYIRWQSGTARSNQCECSTVRSAT